MKKANVIYKKLYTNLANIFEEVLSMQSVIIMNWKASNNTNILLVKQMKFREDNKFLLKNLKLFCLFIIFNLFHFIFPKKSTGHI